MTDKLRELILKEYPNTLGLVVYRKGKKVIEEYFGSSHADASAHVFSITKSIVSLLFGIAEDRGLLSVKDKVLKFFPDYEPKRRQPQLEELTIEHLLTMTAPFKYRYDPWKKVCTSQDWGRTVLEFVGGKTAVGESFRYTTMGIQVLSDIFAAASGKSLNEFAEQELFKPLGIAPVPDAPIRDKASQREFSMATDLRGWARDPVGNYTTGWGLSLTANDMAKIGQLVLEKGCFEGKRIVSESYITRMTTEHTENYGYLWWLYPKGKPITIMKKTFPGCKMDTYCAQGVGGSLIAVIPEADVVISMLCSMKYAPKPRFELINDTLLPLVQGI